MKKAFVTLFALASLCVLLGLTVILGSAISREMARRMAQLKSASISELESVLGHTVTYTSISPSFLNYLEVRDLTIHDSADTGNALLTIHRLRIYYSLVHLLATGDPVGSLREIRILNTRFALDLQKDTTVIDLLQKLTAVGGGESGLHARVTGADVDIVLQTDGTTVTISHLFFQVDTARDALAVSFRGTCHGVLASGFDFTSGVDVSGKVDRAFTWSDLTVRLLSFDSSLFALEKQTLQVVWKGSQVQVHKIEDRSPIDLGVTADLDQQQLTVSFQTDGLRADHLVRFSGAMERFNNWLKAPLTAAGHLTYVFPTHSLAYQAGVSVWFQDQLPVHDLTLDSTFSGTEKGASFSPLRISSPSGSLQFDGSVRYDTFYPEGMLTLVNVDAGTGRRVSADLSIHPRNGGIEVDGRHLLIGQVGFDDFSIALTPEERGSAFTLESSFADAAPGHISAHGELLLRKPVRSALSAGDAEAARLPAITLSASLRDVPPEKLYHLLMGAGTLSRQQEDIRNVLTRCVVNTDLELKTDLSTVTVSSPLVTVTQADNPGTSVRFAALVDSSHVAINDLSGTWKGYSVAGSFEATFAEAGQVGFSSNLAILGTKFILDGRYSDAGGLFVTGSYGLQVSVTPNRDGSYSLQGRASQLPIPVSGSSLAVSFDMGGLYSGPGEWVARAQSFTVYNVPLLESKRNSVSFSARMTPRRLELDQITFTDAYSALTGSAEVSLAMPGRPLWSAFPGNPCRAVQGRPEGCGGGRVLHRAGNIEERDSRNTRCVRRSAARAHAFPLDPWFPFGNGNNCGARGAPVHDAPGEPERWKAWHRPDFHGDRCGPLAGVHPAQRIEDHVPCPQPERWDRIA